MRLGISDGAVRGDIDLLASRHFDILPGISEDRERKQKTQGRSN